MNSIVTLKMKLWWKHDYLLLQFKNVFIGFAFSNQKATIKYPIYLKVKNQLEKNCYCWNHLYSVLPHKLTLSLAIIKTNRNFIASPALIGTSWIYSISEQGIKLQLLFWNLKASQKIQILILPVTGEWPSTCLKATQIKFKM